ncbi:MAG TPA: hypothetical protein VGQ99_13420 [Tepidisphaeraceae bacterium]|nr:hypothetical protein [Tepidisphaeraceae bacterium]
MSQINPFTGAIIQSTQVQQTKSTSQDKHIRRVQNLGKNAALQGDDLEHQVESTDALHPAADRNDSYQPRRQPEHHKKQHQPSPTDPPENIDLTA